MSSSANADDLVATGAEGCHAVCEYCSAGACPWARRRRDPGAEHDYGEAGGRGGGGGAVVGGGGGEAAGGRRVVGAGDAQCAGLRPWGDSAGDRADTVSAEIR